VTAQSFEFDDFDLERFVAEARDFGSERFAYVVTPNADHLLRLSDSLQFRELYSQAGYVLLDSRFASKLIRKRRGLDLPVCTGSDLTARLFTDVIGPDDALVLIGGTEMQAQTLREKYHLSALAHHNPPMGFIRNPEAVDACLAFVEAHSPFRFCLLAVGSPQQEMVAEALLKRGRARGLALCIGASINFLTGGEKRAPLIWQKVGMEWLYRLLQDPKRMWRRYVLNAPRVIALLLTARFSLRRH